MSKVEWEALKVPDAEDAILSSLLSDSDRIYDVMDYLTPDMFYRQQNRTMYEAMLELVDKHINIDMVTLQEILQAKGKLIECGGCSRIIQLGNSHYPLTLIRSYIDVLARCYQRRQIAVMGEEMIHAANNDTADIGDIVCRLAKVAEGHSKAIVPMRENCMRIIDWMESRAKEPMTGIMSGIGPVDVATKGWQKKDLIILAGRPSMGKTAMAMNFAVNAANKGKRILFFSLEMSIEQLGGRLIAMLTGIDSEKVFNPAMLSEDDWGRVLKAQEKISKWNLFIDDTGGLTPAQIMAKSRRVQGRYGLDMIIIDYLQIINGGGKENRVQEIGYITSSLKNLAKEMNVPVIALSQLSRMVEQRSDKRPMMSDLRDGGTIEQDADLIITLFRDKYYNPQNQQDITEFGIKKFRNGRVQTIRLLFEPKTMTFTNAVDFGGHDVKDRDIPL